MLCTAVAAITAQGEDLETAAAVFEYYELKVCHCSQTSNRKYQVAIALLSLFFSSSRFGPTTPNLKNKDGRQLKPKMNLNMNMKIFETF